MSDGLYRFYQDEVDKARGEEAFPGIGGGSFQRQVREDTARKMTIEMTSIHSTEGETYQFRCDNKGHICELIEPDGSTVTRQSDSQWQRTKPNGDLETFTADIKIMPDGLLHYSES